MSALRILSTIPAQPGWVAVFEAGGGPLETRPVISWAVVEGIPGARGPEVCPLLGEATPGQLPALRPLVHGLASHCPPGFLGVCPPGEDPAAWAARARQGPG